MKVWKFLAVGLLLFAIPVYGQTTAPTPTVFKIDDILYPDTSDKRLLIEVPPYVRVETKRGKIAISVRTDSTELDSLSKGQPRTWTLAVRTKTATTTAGVDNVTFRRFQSGYGTTGTFADTTIRLWHNKQVSDVFPGVDYTFHDADSMALNDSVRVWLINKKFASATTDGKIDVNASLSVTPADTITIVTGDTIIVKVKDLDTLTVKVTAKDTVVTSAIVTRGDTITTRPSPLDTIIVRQSGKDTLIVRQSGIDTLTVKVTAKDSVSVLPFYPVDSLTIATDDTSKSKTNVQYTSAFKGRFGYVQAFLDSRPVTGTSTIIGASVQAKRRGSNLWYPFSPVGVTDADSMAFPDSVYTVDFVVPLADSLRIKWWSMRPAMKAIIKTAHVIWRD